MSTNQVVHIIDDDPDVLQALAFMVRTAGLAVEVHGSALAFLDAAPELQNSCIVTDIRMPGMDGLELQQRLAAEDKNVPMIIMTGHADVDLAVSAMKAGAADFIEKPFDYEVLMDAIRSALARQQGNHGTRQLSAEVNNRLQLLSARERQVLEGLVAGKPNKIIADDLGLSTRTIEGYRAAVMAKMQAHNISSLIRMVLADRSAF